jgi:dUTP pyrophosphatase
MSENKIKVNIINQSHHPLPKYQTAGSAGMDLCAFIPEPITLKPLDRILVPTGLFMELPMGYEAQIRPRSGMAIKKGITLVNTPGTIDSDYRGELKIPVINLSNEIQTIEDGERVAQMIIARHETIEWRAVEILNETDRGAGGFGHTGAN